MEQAGNRLADRCRGVGRQMVNYRSHLSPKSRLRLGSWIDAGSADECRLDCRLECMMEWLQASNVVVDLMDGWKWMTSEQGAEMDSAKPKPAVTSNQSIYTSTTHIQSFDASAHESRPSLHTCGQWLARCPVTGRVAETAGMRMDVEVEVGMVIHFYSPTGRCDDVSLLLACPWPCPPADPRQNPVLAPARLHPLLVSSVVYGSVSGSIKLHSNHAVLRPRPPANDPRVKTLVPTPHK